MVLREGRGWRRRGEKRGRDGIWAVIRRDKKGK
jgi:hypothetical protein